MPILRWEHGFAPRPEALAEMGTGALMQTGPPGHVLQRQLGIPQLTERVDFTIALGHYPSGPGGRANYVYYYPLVVPKTTQVPECAWNLLKFFNGPGHGDHHPRRRLAGHIVCRAREVVYHRSAAASQQACHAGCRAGISSRPTPC